MRLLEKTEKFFCVTEAEAKTEMENFRQRAANEDFMIKKIGYEYKCKKAKGEIVDECYILTVVTTHSTIWGE